MKSKVRITIVLVLLLYFGVKIFGRSHLIEPLHTGKDRIETPIVSSHNQSNPEPGGLEVATKPAETAPAHSLSSAPKSNAPQSKNNKSPYEIPSQYVIASLMEGRWVTQGDILVRSDRLVDGQGDAQLRLVEIAEVKRWHEGKVPYEIDPDLDQGLIEQAFKDFHEHTRVRFVPHQGELDYIVFKPSQEVLCQSYLGMQGGPQDVFLNAACGKGQISHELLHALGLVHEQSREDRDEYVMIHWENLDKSYHNQYQKMPAKISIPGGIGFDFDSLMLYPPNAFSQNNEVTMTKKDGTLFKVNRTGLSALDIKKINALYQ